MQHTDTESAAAVVEALLRELNAARLLVMLTGDLDSDQRVVAADLFLTLKFAATELLLLVDQ